MSNATTAPPESDPASTPRAADEAATRARNFLTLAAAQVTMRVGWIFKTESVVIPAALDSLSGAGWVRGMLPLLSRFGLSVAPVFFAPSVRRSPLKKRLVAACMIGMSMCMGLMACVWLGRGAWLSNYRVLAFLVLYSLFFLCHGLNQVAAGTLQGKVVPPNQRGRLITVATTIGSLFAIAAVAWFMPGWLSDSRPRFDLVFAWSAALFALAALILLRVREAPDAEPDATAADGSRDSIMAVIRRDRNFRITLLVAMFTSSSIALFPHYQAIAREQLKLPVGNIVIWVIVQNIGVALFSTVAGPLADKHGNRIVLRLATAGLVGVPLVALMMTKLPQWGGVLYPLVFLGLGITPIAIRIMQNYALEIASPEMHPRYLSMLALCSTAPILLSPVVGYLVDVIGFEVALLTISGLIGCGWLLTYFLVEPRHHTNLKLDGPPLMG